MKPSACPSLRPQALASPWLGGLLVLCMTVCRAQGPDTPHAPASAAAVRAEMEQAVAKVRQIVNQPVTRQTRTLGMRVSTFKPGWFHEGAQKPDFNHVDVRTTQEKIYDKYPYVTSDLNPGVAFVGSQLEFNRNTKYFYTDRTLPKKKLTEAEMLEINRLYRIIGQCEQKLGPSAFTSPASPWHLTPYIGGALVLAFIIFRCLRAGH